MDIRATVKLRNDAMISARERLGLNQHKAAEAAGVSMGTWIALEKLDFSHYSVAYLEEVSFKVAVFLTVPVEEVLPEELIGSNLGKPISQTRQVDPQILLETVGRRDKHCILPDPADECEQEEKEKAIQKALKTLSHREREVINLRFGLADGVTYTLEECGRIFRVGKERILWIEVKALRKLAHPTRSCLLENI